MRGPFFNFLPIRFGVAVISAVSIALFSAGVAAHTGQAALYGGGFDAGFTHPFSGIDHLLVMLSVGIWSGRIGGRVTWLAPLAFVAMMVVGGAVGMAHLPLPHAEIGIALSVAIFGLILAVSWQPNLVIAIGVTGLFALFHGHAHGAEMGVTVSPLLYGLGFVLATAMLHLVGIGIAKVLCQSRQQDALLRWIGVSVSVVGCWLLAT